MSCSDLIDIPGELLSHLSAGEILFSSRFSLIQCSFILLCD